MRGQTCVRRPERLPVCFGMRLVDEHGVRHLELVPRCLAKHVQGATCVRRQTPQLSNSALTVVGEAYDVRR